MRESAIRVVPCFSTSVNRFLNYHVRERAHEQIMKLCSTLERESRRKHELNEIAAYRDPCLGAILREAEPTDS